AHGAPLLPGGRGRRRGRRGAGRRLPRRAGLTPAAARWRSSARTARSASAIRDAGSPASSTPKASGGSGGPPGGRSAARRGGGGGRAGEGGGSWGGRGTARPADTGAQRPERLGLLKDTRQGRPARSSASSAIWRKVQGGSKTTSGRGVVGSHRKSGCASQRT